MTQYDPYHSCPNWKNNSIIKGVIGLLGYAERKAIYNNRQQVNKNEKNQL